MIALTGRRIRELRRRVDLSVEALAHEAGIDRTHLGAIERGQQNPSLRVLHAIAAALHVPVARLVDVDDDRGEDGRRRLAARVRKLRDPELRVLGRLLDALDLIG
jgi:transcriptional regulator with XRE-family HTH domain